MWGTWHRKVLEAGAVEPHLVERRADRIAAVALAIGMHPRLTEIQRGLIGCSARIEEVWMLPTTWFGAAGQYIETGDAGPLLQVLANRKDVDHAKIAEALA